MMNQLQNKYIILGSLCALITMLAVGYAIFNSVLNINGTTTISSNWDIRITNVTEKNIVGTASNLKDENGNEIKPTWENLTATFKTSLVAPGDSIEYDITVTNSGTLSAVLNKISLLESNNPAIKFTSSGLIEGEALNPGDSKILTIKVEYLSSVSENPDNMSTTLNVTLDYGQYGNGTPPAQNSHLLIYDYKTNGGQSSDGVNTYIPENEEVDLTKTAQKDGYNFIGWNTNKDATTALTEYNMPATATILYAIYELKKIEMIIEPNNDNWSKEKIVTINYPLECGEKYICTYKKDNEEITTVSSGNSAEVKMDKNGTIEANIKGKVEIEKKINVEKIDTEDPYIAELELVNQWTMNYTQQINIALTDTHSGVSGYCVLAQTEFEEHDNKKPTVNDECFKAFETPEYGQVVTTTEFLSQGKYYIFIKDKVGNVGGYNPNNPEDPNNVKATFEVKDDTPPTCEIEATGTSGNDNWYIDDVEIKLKSDDVDGSGVRAVELNMTGQEPTIDHYNNITEEQITTDTTGNNYYGYVEDRAGNKVNCNLLNVKRDATPPTCNISTSGTLGKNNWYVSKVTGALNIQNDGFSKISSYDLSFSSTPSYNNQATLTQNVDSSNFNFYGYVKDAAGNTNQCSTNSMKQDTVAPKITQTTTSINSEDTSFQWRAYAIITDDTSGVDKSTHDSRYCYRSTACSYSGTKGCNNNYSIENRPIANLWYEGDWTVTSFSTKCARDNTQTVWFKYCDYAGNCMPYTQVDYYFS